MDLYKYLKKITLKPFPINIYFFIFCFNNCIGANEQILNEIRSLNQAVKFRNFSPEEKRTLESLIKNSFNNSKGNFFTDILKEITSKTVIIVIKKVINALLDYFKEQREMNANVTNTDSMDKSPIPLRYPALVENQFISYQETLKRKINGQNDNNHMPLPNLLLAGPAGTGKTTGIKRIVEVVQKFIEDNKDKLYITGICLEIYKGGEMYGKGVAEATRILNNKFDIWEEKANKSGKIVIIFFDEMEVVFPNRENTGNSDKNDLITTFLSFTGNPKKNIIIIGATNHESVLDPAVRRRFTNFIEVKAPDLATLILIAIDYIEYYGKSEYIYQNFDYRMHQSYLYWMAERLISMSGADIDNIIKKSIEESASNLGFVYWAIIKKNMYDEIYKKATFSIKMNDDKKSELLRMLSLPLFTWFNVVNPYGQLTMVGFDYQQLLINVNSSVLYVINGDLYHSLLRYDYARTLCNQFIAYNDFLNISIAGENSYLINKYMGKGLCVKKNIKQIMNQSIAANNLLSNQSLCFELPKNNYLLSKIESNDKIVNSESNTKRINFLKRKGLDLQSAIKIINKSEDFEEIEPQDNKIKSSQSTPKKNSPKINSITKPKKNTTYKEVKSPNNNQ